MSLSLIAERAIICSAVMYNMFIFVQNLFLKPNIYPKILHVSKSKQILWVYVVVNVAF